jgi:hypothetical protein
MANGPDRMPELDATLSLNLPASFTFDDFMLVLPPKLTVIFDQILIL